ncbi:MAG: hypothetical protein JHC33_06245 [Ignisphaera sp.]|nr:hypothetical protein [Ignisphaera sp.]
MKKLVRDVELSEEASNTLAKELLTRLRGKERVAILFCGASEGVARHLETVLRLANEKINAVVVNGDYASNMLLPYISEGLEASIVLTSPHSIGCLNRVAYTSRILGLDTLLIAPRPLPLASGPLQQVLEGSIEIEASMYRLTVSLASIKLGLAMNSDVKRIKRLENEVSVASVVEDMIKVYSKTVEDVEKCRTVVVTHSLLSVGEELGELGYIYTTVDKASMVWQAIPEATALFYTSAEEHIVREELAHTLRVRTQPKHVVHVRINTDPLTAPIYGLIMAHYIKLHKAIFASNTHISQ